MKFTEHRNYSTTWFHCSLNQKRVYIKYKCYISTARSICFSSTENQTFKDNVNTIRWDHHWTCHYKPSTRLELNRPHLWLLGGWQVTYKQNRLCCYGRNYIMLRPKRHQEDGEYGTWGERGRRILFGEEGGYCSEGQEHNQRLPDHIWTHGSFSSANFSPRLSKKEEKVSPPCHAWSEPWNLPFLLG